MSTAPPEPVAERGDGAHAVTTHRPNPLVRAGGALGAAVMFLTIIPLPRGLRPGSAQAFADGAAYFPVVGAAIGAVAGGVRVASYHALGPDVSTALAIAATVVVTGALHQDAFADVADALGARGGSRERRLAVMRDSTIGAFGAIALIVWALLLFTAVARIDGHDGLMVLIGAGALGRMAAVVHGRLTSPARSDGLGAAFKPASLTCAVAIVFGFAAALLADGVLHGAIVGAVAVLTAAATSAGARRAFGGSTGDTLGATALLAELAVVLVLVGLARP